MHKTAFIVFIGNLAYGVCLSEEQAERVVEKNRRGRTDSLWSFAEVPIIEPEES
jgi:hypothetical protein